MKQWTLVFCWSLLAGGVFAQEQDTLWKRHFTAEELAIFDQKEDTLGLMAYFVINDSLPENRFAACHKLIPTLVSTLKTPNSFQYPFERLKSVSIMYPPDSSFRIFTLSGQFQGTQDTHHVSDCSLLGLHEQHQLVVSSSPARLRVMWFHGLCCSRKFLVHAR